MSEPPDVVRFRMKPDPNPLDLPPGFKGWVCLDDGTRYLVPSDETLDDTLRLVASGLERRP